VTLDPEPIYVHDRGVYTSAGSTASIDLVLGLVEEDFGRRVAQSVALHMVLFLKRPSGQAQMSVPLSTGLAERGVLRELQLWIVDHIGEDLGGAALARRVAMSPRNFFRVFSHELGVSPRDSWSAHGSRPHASSWRTPRRASMPLPPVAASAALKPCARRSSECCG
jgi:transcriptional regulator GlxA family with amidase domain